MDYKWLVPMVSNSVITAVLSLTNKKVFITSTIQAIDYSSKLKRILNFTFNSSRGKLSHQVDRCTHSKPLISQNVWIKSIPIFPQTLSNDSPRISTTIVGLICRQKISMYLLHICNNVDKTSRLLAPHRYHQVCKINLISWSLCPSCKIGQSWHPFGSIN